MRNLRLLHTTHVSPLPETGGCSHMSIDPDAGRIILVSGSRVVVLDPATQQVTHIQSLLTDVALTPESQGHVVGVQFLPDQSGVCLATSNGNLTLWTLNPNELECVGSVDSGLTAMQWSPDLELLVLTTGSTTLLLMTREFDPLTEVALHSTEAGEDEFMTVGWGKKETQFHGSAGKQAAVAKREEGQGLVSWDDGKPRICWRGDGQFFAVSSVSPTTQMRCIYVWSRDGVLQSRSEPTSGLEQALFWKPSGALIASSQRKPNRHEVIFFEKNGLRHGEFTLSSGKQDLKVLEVMWNVDSTVLAVWSQQVPPQGENIAQPASRVQLWTCSNYHWSLKQTLTFDCECGDLVALTWDPEQAGRLHAVTAEGHYLQYTWTWATNRSLGQTSYDPANVFVIDGTTLKVTPMRRMVVPPPMSTHQLPLPASAVQVVSPASPPDVTGHVAVLTDDNQLLVFSTSSDGGSKNNPNEMTKADEPKLQATYRLVLPDCVERFPLCITHISWVRRDTLVFSVHGAGGAFLSTLRLPENITEGDLPLGPPVPVEADVLSLSVNPCSPGSVAVQLSSGDVLRYSTDDDTLLPWETADGKELCFPFPCVQMEVTSFRGEEAVIGLTDRFRFYVNGVEVASNCTSFAVHDEFLLMTTLSHTIRCICRHTAVKDLPSLSDGKAHPFDESIRRVERGSRIVTVVAEDTKVVLQMPRGNLETIHPRALVLATVRRHLDRLDFGAAFSIMKKHRINLNLLYDHNPDAFLQNVKLLLDEIPKVSDVNLFLTELQDDDVTLTMYTAAYNRTSTMTPVSSTASISSQVGPQVSKVDTVCDAVRIAMETLGADRFRLAILTTFVRKSKPELQKALEMVWQLRVSGEECRGVSAEEAIKFLLFLVDVNKLYDAALATYNFDLVLMVAERSQKDPKEYIPFLNQLRRLDTNYCRFTIDKHLKNYSSALKHIALCGADHFSECVDMVQEHKLFIDALALFCTDSFEFKTLAREYGQYLSEKNRHDEAGIMFARAEYWQMALDAFVVALNWRQAFCMAARLQLNRTRTVDLARRVAVQLKERRRHSESAVVYEQYAKDVEEAIVTLIEGALWDEALRLMYSHGRTDIIETHLREAIEHSCQETMATLQRQQAEMLRCVDRLAVVRMEKEQRCQEMWGGGDRPDDVNADLFSDTSSMTGGSTSSSQLTIDSNRSTVFSKTSGRSGRNRRKAERKKWSLKEGSPFEDCALIEAIAKIITVTDTMKEEIRDLLHVLTLFNEVKAGERLQQQYDSFLAAIEKILPLVWVQEETAGSSMMLGPGMTANAIAQAVQEGRNVGSSDRTDPVLKVPPQLKKDVRWKLHILQTVDKAKDGKVRSLPENL